MTMASRAMISQMRQSLSWYSKRVWPSIAPRIPLDTAARTAVCNREAVANIRGLRMVSTTTTTSSDIPVNYAGVECPRTHGCGEINVDDVGQEVHLCGWVQQIRGINKDLDFVTLRDSYGEVQLIVSAGSIPSLESVIRVSGVVKERPGKQANSKMATGNFEVHVDDIVVLNKSEALPFPLVDKKGQANEQLRQTYRYLDLRRSELQWNLQTRSIVSFAARQYMMEHGFVEIETPTLFRRTPGGAAEFPVPTRKAGEFYSLVQSPQQFKQLLMVGGMDRYFQLARCYRDEGGRGDRQPEFTQIDLELSFTTQKEIEALVEGLIRELWLEGIEMEITTPFKRMTYEHAMSKYGVDKPDTRYEMCLQDVTYCLKNGEQSNIFATAQSPGNVLMGIKMDDASAFVNKKANKDFQSHVHGLGYQGISVITIEDDGSWNWHGGSKNLTNDTDRDEINKEFNVVGGDVLLLATGQKAKVIDLLGKIRTYAADFLELNGRELRDPKQFNFLWVDDFPLFEVDEETGQLMSTHHVFTAPKPGDEKYLLDDPIKVHGQHMDLVLNGVELGGGSIRNHNADMQRFIIENVLKEDVSAFQHIIDALALGAPPHGGIALGFDRLMMVLMGTENLRDVLAFPKSFAGRDLMGGSPCSISDDYLDEYNISVKSKKNSC